MHPTADRLARDFGARSELAKSGVRAFFAAHRGARCREAAACFGRWHSLLGAATGHDLDRPDRAFDLLSAAYALPPGHARPAELLFAVHTYYALVVKLLVRQALRRPGPADGSPRTTRQRSLRVEMTALESGRTLAGRLLVPDAAQNAFGWYTAAWSDEMESLVRRLIDGLALASAAQRPGSHPTAPEDVFRTLYESLLPKPVRHRLGEYYTPGWLAEHVLDTVGYRGLPGERLLDPACGSGTFLVGAIRRALDTGAPPLRDIADCIVGFDIHPLAVLSARANYVLAIQPRVDDWATIEIPVYVRDAVLMPAVDEAAGRALAPSRRGAVAGPCGKASRPAAARFDFVVGNPPWIVWDHLPEDYRRATEPLWRKYGLFSLSASEARHGGGKKDLSALMTYVAADRFLRSGGRLGFVVTQTLFQTKGAGDGFRLFRLGDGEPLKVLRVDDLSALRPFPGAANWTAVVVLEKGSPTVYPVPYFQWSASDKLPSPGTDRRLVGSGAKGEGNSRSDAPPTAPRHLLAEPIDPTRRTSPWFVRPEGLRTPLARLVGPSDYRAHLGANTGGANGVFWLEVLQPVRGGVRVRNRPEDNRRRLPQVDAVIEPDLVYPLVRWSDVQRWRAAPSGCILLAQDLQSRRGIEPLRMQCEHPRTLAYLSQFEPLLRARAAYRRYQRDAAFYSMYDVGPYTATRHKAVWRRMDRRMNAAVLDEVDHPILGRRPAVPQETCVLVAAASSDEAHYLSAALNSAVVDFLVRAHSVRGGKGFGTPSLLELVRLRRFDPADLRHAALAALSRQAHETVASGSADEELAPLQQAIDVLAGELWELSRGELEAIRASLTA